MILIQKDTSGKTYEYRFMNSEKEVMIGDGYSSVEEVMNFVKELLDSISGESNAKIYIGVDEDGEDRNFVYTNKIVGNNVNKNMSVFGFESDIKEV